MIRTIDYQDYTPSRDFFSGKTILVTGAADGIGRALSISLAEYGCTVLMLDRKARHLEKLSDYIVGRGYVEPLILPVDLMDISAQTATVLAQAVKDDLGKLDALVHNAAELGSPSPMDQYDLEYWNKVMQTNLHAPYLLTRAMLPLLKQEYTTSLLFTSADVGREAQAYWGAYSIAYAGIEAQMRIWALELERVSNIKVNSIDPGPIRTSFRRRSHPGESQESLLPPQAIMPGYLKLLENREHAHAVQFTLQNQGN